MNFDLHLNRALSGREEDILTTTGLDASPVRFADGSGYLMCTTDASTLTEAVARTATTVHGAMPRVWATGLGLDDSVTLADAARRTGGIHGEWFLRKLADGTTGPAGFPAALADGGFEPLYSWAEVAAFLRDELGDDIPRVDLEAVVLDRVLAARAAVHTARAEVVWEQFSAA